jgi:hypothetical protein
VFIIIIIIIVVVVATTSTTIILILNWGWDNSEVGGRLGCGQDRLGLDFLQM